MSPTNNNSINNSNTEDGVPPKELEAALECQVKVSAIRVHSKKWMVPTCHLIHIGNCAILARYKGS